MPASSRMPPLKSESAGLVRLESLRAKDRLAAPQIGDFPSTYQTFIVHDSGNWNHPCVGGVMVDVETGDVIYFAEH